MPFHSYVIWSCSLFVLIILCCDSFHRLNAESLNAESPIPNWTECRNNKCQIPQLPICTECQIFECRMELEISNAELDWRPIVTEYFHLRTDWHWNTGWCWRWGGRCDTNFGIDDRTTRGGANRRGPRLLGNRKMLLQKHLEINTWMVKNLNPGSGNQDKHSRSATLIQTIMQCCGSGSLCFGPPGSASGSVSHNYRSGFLLHKKIGNVVSTIQFIKKFNHWEWTHQVPILKHSLWLYPATFPQRTIHLHNSI